MLFSLTLSLSLWAFILWNFVVDDSILKHVLLVFLSHSFLTFWFIDSFVTQHSISLLLGLHVCVHIYIYIHVFIYLFFPVCVIDVLSRNTKLWVCEIKRNNTHRITDGLLFFSSTSNEGRRWEWRHLCPHRWSDPGAIYCYLSNKSVEKSVNFFTRISISFEYILLSEAEEKDETE